MNGAAMMSSVDAADNSWAVVCCQWNHRALLLQRKLDANVADPRVNDDAQRDGRDAYNSGNVARIPFTQC